LAYKDTKESERSKDECLVIGAEETREVEVAPCGGGSDGGGGGGGGGDEVVEVRLCR